MQSKGIIKWLAVLLAVASIFQLSFTFVTRNVENEAEAYAKESAEATVAEKKADIEAKAKENFRNEVMGATLRDSLMTEEEYNVLIDQLVAEKWNAEDVLANFDEQSEYSKAFADAERSYLEGKWDEPVYNLFVVNYTYGDCKNRELNLGLDLRGGMNVMLEVKPADVIRLDLEECLEYSINKEFAKRMDTALHASAKEKESVEAAIKIFVDTCKDDELIKLYGLTVDDGNADLEATKKAEPVVETVTEETAIKVDSEATVKAEPKTTMKADRDAIKKHIAERVNESTEGVLEGLKRRIDALGVVQPNIQRVIGTNRISIELPGIKEPERVKKILSSSATLEFWEVGTAVQVEKMRDAILKGNMLAGINYNMDAVDYSYCVLTANHSDIDKINNILAEPDNKAMLPFGMKLAWENKSVDNETYGDYRLLVLNGSTPLMKGDGITDATAQSVDPTRGAGFVVSMTMDSESTRKWANITANHVNQQIAIVMDGVVYSAPVVNGRIDGASSITGDFTVQEAEDLANVLKAGSAPARATIVYSEVVGPSLGEKAINSGLISFLIAFLLVLLYMAFFYRTAGWMANIALLFNVLLLMGVLVSFGAVLTLPGIAGIVLTMGMAVDANVIIFERIKEELRSGKGLALAIKDGFSNAYSAIIDGNLTTIITGAVLFFFGTGPVKGFATTLVVGIITSLFCAILITRVLLEAWAARRGGVSFSRKCTENFMQNVKFSFISKRKYSYIISGILLVASVISFFTLGLNQGVEFTGGRTYIVKFDNAINVDDVRDDVAEAFEAVADAANASVEVKQFGDDNQIRVVTQFDPSDKMDVIKETYTAKYNEAYGDDAEVLAEKLAIVNAITEDDAVEFILWDATEKHYVKSLDFESEFSDNNESAGITQSSKVDKSISGEMTWNSILAVLFSLVAIGIYIAIRFRRWQWATGATFALFHNALLVIGIFSMLYAIMPFNLEVNQAFIAAILTIIGYSINDTVVIFDRIREYIGLYPKRDMKTNIDAAICNTLSRTVNTSATTLVTLLAIFFFGGESIRGFVFALILGIIIGTYSSVFIATPIAYDLQRKKAAKATEGETK